MYLGTCSENEDKILKTVDALTFQKKKEAYKFGGHHEGVKNVTLLCCKNHKKKNEFYFVSQ